MQISELYSVFIQSTGVCTDTRQLKKGSIFFALKGGNFNGNLFAEQAVQSGCSYAVVDEMTTSNEKFIRVEDVLACLQELASYHRKKLGIKIIAITGSNGKTTTKELLHHVLSSCFNTLSTDGNFNNHIGVPLTLLRLTNEHEIGIIEMGANHVGEIQHLATLASPDIGIITNIGKAHLEGFGSFEGVIKAKTELYRFIAKNKGTIFYNASDTLIKEQVDELSGIELIDYGTEGAFQYTARLIDSAPFLKAELFIKNTKSGEVNTQLAGAYNLENIAAAFAFATYFSIPFVNVASALEAYSPTNSRSQVLETKYNKVLLDAYNANPSSMSVALKAFSNYQSVQKKCVILGGMKELGEYSNAEHKKILTSLNTYKFNDVLLVGEEYKGLRGSYHWFAKTEDMVKFLQEKPLTDKFILVKGSRSNKLEVLIPHL